jgi:hypothetical protein
MQQLSTGDNAPPVEFGLHGAKAAPDVFDALSGAWGVLTL